MKRLSYLFIAAFAFLSVAAKLLLAYDSEKNASQTFRVFCHNKDIGPVRDGRFLEDQAYLVNGGIKGKSPGSGLFNIPVGAGQTIEDCYSLFSMFPSITVILKNGIMEHGNQKTLGLPGISTPIEISVDPSSILLITVQLYTWKYGFTTGGGSVWIQKDSQPTAISPPVAYRPTENFPEELFAVFSWPTVGPYRGKEEILPK